ncbi:hypothetical protein VARIO8X_130165 [Burkholderiales bacterium 8X]|nr:hypothetical protein VARIO8X_130165 [Burkholderiales bacterium 8X]
MAREPVDRLQGQHRHDHPRPELLESGGDPHRRTRPRQAVVVPRQLRAISGAERRTTRPGGRDQRQGGQAAGAGRDLDSQRRRSSPHAEPEPHRSPRGFARQAPRSPGSRRQREPRRRIGRAQRQDRRRTVIGIEGLRREGRDPRLQRHDSPWRQGRLDRPQRRRQDHSPEADPRRARARQRQGSTRHQFASRLLRPDAGSTRSRCHAGRLHQSRQRMDRNRKPAQARQELLVRLPVLTRQGAVAGSLVERRGTQPPAACTALCEARQCAGARRAHQRPGHRYARVARGTAAVLRRNGVPREPRSHLPRQRGHQHDRVRGRWSLARVRRQRAGLADPIAQVPRNGSPATGGGGGDSDGGFGLEVGRWIQRRAGSLRSIGIGIGIGVNIGISADANAAASQEAQLQGPARVGDPSPTDCSARRRATPHQRDPRARRRRHLRRGAFASRRAQRATCPNRGRTARRIGALGRTHKRRLRLRPGVVRPTRDRC